MKLGNKLNNMRNWGLPYVRPVVAWNQSFQRNMLKVDRHFARSCLDHLMLKMKNPGLWVTIIWPAAKVSHGLHRTRHKGARQAVAITRLAHLQGRAVASSRECHQDFTAHSRSLSNRCCWVIHAHKWLPWQFHQLGLNFHLFHDFMKWFLPLNHIYHFLWDIGIFFF